MSSEPEIQGFVNALEGHLDEHGADEARRGEALIREIEAMFQVMEPAVAAATLALRVVEDRLKEGRDHRTAADFSAAGLAVTREMDLSRIFAELLDPGGDHAQGATFLSLLLEELRLALPKAAKKLTSVWSAPGAGSRVTTERSTGPIEMADGSTRSGSIDIFIELGGDRWIAIENKPWAGQQPEQVARYLRCLAQLSSDSDAVAGNAEKEKFLLLYWVGWTGEGSDPDFGSLSDELRDRCIKMPYRETSDFPSVEGWLRRCAVACEAPRVRSFLIDLIRYVEREFQR